MSLRFGLVLLALCSLAAAAAPPCEELIKPQGNRTQVTGKWILHASISESKETEEKLKAIISSWIEISAVADSEEMVLRWADRMKEKCLYGSFNYTFSSNISQVSIEYNSTTYDYTGHYLETCPDCLVWEDTMTNNQKGRSLYIFTKNGSLEDSHLETFKRQASCLGLPAEMYIPGTANLCPDAPDAKEEKQDK